MEYSHTQIGERRRKLWPQHLQHLWTKDYWQQQLGQIWQQIGPYPTRRIALTSAVLILGLTLIGTILYQAFYPKISWLEAFHATTSLLLGGYGDVYGGVELENKTPVWLYFFSLSLALLGTAFVGVLYAVLTENLLTARLNFLQRRHPIPKEKHIILIGLESFGQKMSEFLQNLKQPIVGINQTKLEPTAFDQTPLLIGDPIQRLTQANLSTALSVVVATATTSCPYCTSDPGKL